MKKNLSFLLLGCFSFLMSACDLIEYHPYDTRVDGPTNLNASNISRIEQITAGKRTFRFAMISDTQRSYDETKAAVRHLNTRGDIDFVVHGGDQADFGETKEFIWTRDFLNQLNVPYVCVLGNHDCLGTGRNVFRKVYGPEDYVFTAGNVRFIVLNTNALEYDYSHPVPNFTLLENEILRDPYGAEKTVVVMHVPPYDVEFNNNVVKPFGRYIALLPGIQFCLYGHNHHFEENEPFDDGIMYYGCTCIDERAYFLITIKEDGYEVEQCTF